MTIHRHQQARWRDADVGDIVVKAVAVGVRNIVKRLAAIVGKLERVVGARKTGKCKLETAVMRFCQKYYPLYSFLGSRHARKLALKYSFVQLPTTSS